MNVLITGGLGFIGGHTAIAFATAGHKVTCVDRAETSFTRSDLAAYGVTTRLRTIDFEYLMNHEENPDVVVHLASPVGPGAIAQAGGTIVTDIIEATHVAVLLANGGRLINVSSSEAFGGGVDLTATAPASIPAGWTPRREYAVGKLAAEHVVAGHCATSGLQAVSIRPFNVAGARQRADLGFVIPRFVGQALQHRPLTIYGDGKQARAIIDVRDVATALVAFASSSTPAWEGEVYTVANPGNTTRVADLARLVLYETPGSRSTIDLVDPREKWGPLYVEADGTTKLPARALDPPALEWAPVYGLQAIVKSAVAWARTLQVM